MEGFEFLKCPTCGEYVRVPASATGNPGRHCPEPKPPRPELFVLGDDCFAVEFPFHIVTQRTFGMATRDFVRGDFGLSGLFRYRFAEEAADTAGTLRADSGEMRRLFPAETAMLKEEVGDRLGGYVIFRVERI